MKLEDMNIRDILEKYDFPETFLKEFAEWCDKQPREESEVFRMSGLLDLIYTRNPSLKMMPVTPDSEEDK